MASKSLIEKLVEVASAIRNVEKNGRNDAQKYDFVSEADVVRKVMPELLSRGVLMYPRHKVAAQPETFTTQKGSVQVLTTIESTWVFTDGTEELEVVTVGQGTDSGDKGVYKAMTGAKKYAILQALGIATGDDPEIARDDEKAEAKPKRVSKTSGEELMENSQLRRIFGIGKGDLGMSDDEIKAFVTKETGKRSSKQVTKAEADKLIKLLEVRAATDGGEVVDEEAA